MILAADAHYFGSAAMPRGRVAGVLFESWEDSSPALASALERPCSADYEPGQFFRREMPLLLALLETLDASGHRPECVVVDGYAWLGGLGPADARPGLGAHLWEALGRSIPVVGVAKTRFEGTPSEQEIFRGQSARPLFVSAAGMGQSEAMRRVASMHGSHRLPTLLARVDRLCRDGVAPPTPPATRAPAFSRRPSS